ncbi:MAG: hypothetical protein NC926_06765 [Candidatus Omnitrophica bacterium]|nr:hypothetical protein [Candidatus Omnitrophota bacterium]
METDKKNIYVERIHDYRLAQGEFVLLFYDLHKEFKLEIRENLGYSFSEFKEEFPKYCYYFHLWGRIPEGKNKLWIDGPWAEIDLNIFENEIVIKNDAFRRCDIYLCISEDKIFVTNSCRYVLANSKEFDYKGMISLLVLKYVPPPFSLYRGWYKLPMGHEAHLNIVNKRLRFVPNYNIPSYPIIYFEDALKILKEKLFLSLTPLITENHDKYAGLVSGGVDSTLLLLIFLEKYPELANKLFILSFVRPVDKIADILKINAIMRKRNISKNHLILIFDTRSDEYISIWKEILRDNIDYLHFGKGHLFWAFKILKNEGIKNCFCGESADAITEFELSSDTFVSRLKRMAYDLRFYPLIKNIYAPRRAIKNIVSSFPLHKLKIIDYIFSLIFSIGEPDSYYGGIVFNYQFYPGLSTKQKLALGEQNKEIVEEILKEIRARYFPKNMDISRQKIPSILLRMILDTLNGCADARVLEIASKLNGIKLIMPYLTKEIVELFSRLAWSERKFWSTPKKLIKMNLYSMLKNIYKENLDSLLNIQLENISLAKWYIRDKFFRIILEDLKKSNITEMFEKLGINAIYFHKIINEASQNPDEISDKKRFIIFELWQIYNWFINLGKSL